MPKHIFQLNAILQRLENDTCLAEGPFFPEVSTLDDESEQALKGLKRVVRALAAKDDLSNAWRRHTSGPPVVDEMKIELKPPKPSAAWQEPVELKFGFVRWLHGEKTHVAYVPALGIKILAENEEDLRHRISKEIERTLHRKKLAGSLKHLVWLQRCRELSLEPVTFETELQTPKERARGKAESEDEMEKKSLKGVTSDLTKMAAGEKAYELEHTVGLIAESLTDRPPSSVLLVGPSGVGKTASVHELVRERSKLGLSGRPFWVTSGSRLVAGMSDFGGWEERCQLLRKASARRKAVIHLGNLLELVEVGKSEFQTELGVAQFLRPYISRGEFLCIAECLPEQLSLIEKRDPLLLTAFHQIKVEEPDVETGKSILLSTALAGAKPGEEPVDTESIEALDRLHRRYTTYSAYPGRPLRFLKNLLEDRSDDESIGPDDVAAAFSRETGLPLFLLDDSKRLDLKKAEQWFSERVIGQPDAVNLVCDLLATVKAGLARPGKPIASLLFIGPTGVGKTEMAKSLAEFLFQDRSRMVRFDMSEFADPVSVIRLVGGLGSDEGLLTAKVREQPFCVVLLDEFEKADPSFFDLLLQILGEGRLTDGQGRVASFTNTVVIMTSNLGADSFSRGAAGFIQKEGDRPSTYEHFTEEVRKFVRPELFNRIDRVIPFAPLERETIHRIARREIELIRSRDGIRFRGVGLDVAEEVFGYLVARGYDHRYGARPLRRAIESELLKPVSAQLNGYTDRFPLTTEADLIEGRLVVQTKARQEGRSISSAFLRSPQATICKMTTELRRDIQELAAMPAVEGIRNEIHRLEDLQKLRKKRPWLGQEIEGELARLPRLKKVENELEQLTTSIFELEMKLLTALYQGESADADRAQLDEYRQRYDQAILEIHLLRFERSDFVALAVYGQDTNRLFELANVYYQVAIETAEVTDLFRFHLKEKTPDISEMRIPDPESYLKKLQAGTIGLGMLIKGKHALIRFGPEAGLHRFRTKNQTSPLLVQTWPRYSDPESETTEEKVRRLAREEGKIPAIKEYRRLTEERLKESKEAVEALLEAEERLKESKEAVEALLEASEHFTHPEGVKRRSGIGHQNKRRLYLPEQRMATDEVLGEEFQYSPRNLRPLANAIEKNMVQEAVKALRTS
ncbi:MAG: AAA family ATPase [Planctomycetota bacterium]|jgi:ATP-dependent Clp protease ATP-binding subunit ClpA|nr:AAA family ATPase [Planctomycetota bacterium]